MDKDVNAGAGIYCILFSFYLPLGQHATHFDGETEAVNTALIQLLCGIGSFEKAVIFSNSVSLIHSIATFYALPSKRVAEIQSSMNLLKGLQKNFCEYHATVVLRVTK
jgi:hypothetical protein